MKKAGIHIRLMAAAFLLISAATFTLDLVGVHITRQFMYKRFKDRVTFLAKYLALNSEVGVLIGDRAGLKSLALNLLGEEDVARVIIMDNQSKELVNLYREVKGALSTVETPVLFKKSSDDNLIFNTRRTNPFAPVREPVTEVIGTVKIFFSTHGINQLMVDITRQFIWLSLGLVIMAGCLFYFISRAIVSEVKQLRHTARQVASGRIELRAVPGRIPETAELAAAFNTMLDSLEKSRSALEHAQQEMIRQKSLAEIGKFSMIVAHEVKNPLGIIKSSLDILKKDADLPSDNVMVEYMEDEIRRLNRLIEEFLSFARPSEPTLREVDLNQMLREIIDRFEVQIIESSLTINALIPPRSFEVNADRDLLSRGINNIIKNACEASKDGGCIHVDVSCQGERWVLEVKDGGEGILPEHMDKIFEPFFTTRSKGTGLGLAFAAQVIGAHGGQISAQNREEGQGAVFRIELQKSLSNAGGSLNG